jgi:hypothetical protein
LAVVAILNFELGSSLLFNCSLVDYFRFASI